MARSSLKIADARDALAAFEDALSVENPNNRDRDSAVLNFMLAAEAMWKAAQSVLLERYGGSRPLEPGPKGTVRESRVAGLLVDDDAEYAMTVVEDRNLVVHTYRKALAEELQSRLGEHAALLRRWLHSIEAAAQRDPSPPSV
jgi:hypothetical protein